MTFTAPTLADLREAARIFNGFTGVDTSWLHFQDVTDPAPDLSRRTHRDALLLWLNSWGCRIRYPRNGEPLVFDDALAAWWQKWGGALPTGGLATLPDGDLDTVARAYGDLAAVPVSAGPRTRSLAPTAAAKALYALRPHAVMPWDAAIAARLYGARDAAAFALHLRTGRAWATALLASARVGEDALPGLVGRPGVTLAKVLDEYLYVTLSWSGATQTPPS